MPLTAIDHLILPVADLAAAAAPFEKLGLTLTPAMKHAGAATENRALFVGNEATEFYIELLGVHDRALAAATAQQDLLDAIAAGGASRLVLRHDDLDAAETAFARAGISAPRREVARDTGEKICDVLRPGLAGRAGCELSVIRYPESAESRIGRHKGAGLFAHALPLLRLDHLAVIAPALDETTAFWTDVLGVPVFGEVRGRGMVIRQLKIGDAIVELLGPDSPESPLASRPAGLISMAAFEVANLDAAVEIARAHGFTAADGAPGVLPRSRTSTISPDQLSGLALQLIEFS